MNLLARTTRAVRRAVALVALAALSSCSNLDNFDVAVDGKAQVQKATLVEKLLGQVEFTGLNQIDFTEEFKNQGVTKNDVDSVHLKSMTLSITAPPDGRFDFLSSLAFFAEADGLDKVQIASLDVVPKGMKELNLLVNKSAELKPYVVAPVMRITTHIEGTRPDQDTTIEVHAVLDVDVHIPVLN